MSVFCQSTDEVKFGIYMYIMFCITGILLVEPPVDSSSCSIGYVCIRSQSLRITICHYGNEFFTDDLIHPWVNWVYR